MIRQRITFYGYVQGVGFRWKSQTVANSLRLTGWVYNEYYVIGARILRLRNILIVVSDIEKSIQFYKELFGLHIFSKKNMIWILESLDRKRQNQILCVV